MISSLVLIVAYVLDLVVGDPQWKFHPVRLLGHCISCAERILRAKAFIWMGETACGVLLCIGVVALCYAAARLMLSYAFNLHPYAGYGVSIVFLYFALSARALGAAAREVRNALDTGDLQRARHLLAQIVGRDTAELEPEEVMRASVETVAENTSDGVIAPLFYALLGGPALAVAYKAVNTLDSMVGYRNERYRAMGWASARCDDLANYLPARLTGLLLTVAAVVARKDGKEAFKIMRRDARRHESPNSGYPEAAMAGALGVQLGGPSTYQGRLRMSALLGERRRRLTGQTIQEAVLLMHLSSGLMVLLCLCYLLCREMFR